MVYFADTFSCEDEAEVTVHIGEVCFAAHSLNQLLEELAGRSGSEARCQKIREEIRQYEELLYQLEGTAGSF